MYGLAIVGNQTWKTCGRAEQLSANRLDERTREKRLQLELNRTAPGPCCELGLQRGDRGRDQCLAVENKTL